MKAFVTSVGEKTTKLCCEQLEKFGYDVVLLDEIEPWVDKYKRFITMADDECVRVDADIIVNENFKVDNIFSSENYYMVQFSHYDLYKNNIGIGAPMYYSKKGIETIRKNLDFIQEARPETSAWRFPEVVDYTNTSKMIVGIHGFFQDKETMERAKNNKVQRGQMNLHDFDLAFKLVNL